MELEEFFTVRPPLLWASVPSIFSHTALNQIKSCPLRFQLERSEFPEIGRFPPRPNLAAVEGTIVHECLEQLFKVFSLAGMPELGSKEACECSRSIGLTTVIQEKLNESYNRIAGHPNGGGFRKKRSTRQLANQVIRLFRQQYSTLSKNAEQSVAMKISSKKIFTVTSDLSGLLRKAGALTEWKLQHPALPFSGKIDLVCFRDGITEIVDFKAGKQDPSHLVQLRRYALLWWRCSGQMPGRIRVRYAMKTTVESITESILVQTEKELEAEILGAKKTLNCTPAKTVIGNHCSYCDVRQFCDQFWGSDAQSYRSRGEFSDVQLAVESEVSEYGFHATDVEGKIVAITSPAHIGKLRFRGLTRGMWLRMIGVRLEPRAAEIHVTVTSEVWRLGSACSALS